MKYANIDERGAVLGWYDPAIHKAIPTPYVEVSDETWRKAIDLGANAYANNEFVRRQWGPQSKEEAQFAIKAAAAGAIEGAYPIHKQLNLQADSSYAQNAIAGLTGLTGDEVMQRAVSKVGLTDDPEALKAARDQVEELDLADIVADIPSRLALAFPPAQVQFMASLIDGYFRTLVVCICGYRLIRLVRIWSNQKEVELAALTELAALEAFDPAGGCPDIA